MQNKKVYVVNFSLEKNDDKTPMKVFSSLLKAKNYCEEKASNLFYKNNSIEPEKYTTFWEDNFTYIVQVGPKEYVYEIEEADLDEDIKDVSRPEIEIENENLKKENLELKDELSKQMSMNAAAKCYLVMYDGGWKYTKEHIIENMHAARNILEGNEKGKCTLEEMFEKWIASKGINNEE